MQFSQSFNGYFNRIRSLSKHTYLSFICFHFSFIIISTFLESKKNISGLEELVKDIVRIQVLKFPKPVHRAVKIKVKYETRVYV